VNGSDNAGKDRNIKCDVKKSEMGTGQRTNPSPVHIFRKEKKHGQKEKRGQNERAGPGLQGNRNGRARPGT
jgi:hypothetical protein